MASTSRQDRRLAAAAAKKRAEELAEAEAA
jgi:hypothetical protein